jgi:hypothetical protein
MMLSFHSRLSVYARCQPQALEHLIFLMGGGDKVFCLPGLVVQRQIREQ